MDNIPHTSENVYQIMREDESWTKDELVDYIIDLEKIVNEWWEEKQKEYVKVVRCKDCKWWKTDWYKGVHGECPNVFAEADFYCADGERKEQEDDKRRTD